MKGSDIIIGAHVRDREFAYRFAEPLARVLNRNPPRPIPLEAGMFLVTVQSKILHDLLRKTIVNTTIRRTLKNVPVAFCGVFLPPIHQSGNQTKLLQENRNYDSEKTAAT
ncbi:MAG: hypothetical protein QXI97_00775 [Nitrososphaerota archaeon]